jgi:hypothetical protein
VGLSKWRFLTTVAVGTDSSQLLITSKPEVVKLVIVPAHQALPRFSSPVVHWQFSHAPALCPYPHAQPSGNLHDQMTPASKRSLHLDIPKENSGVVRSRSV